eukprot:gene2614-biopygen6526
MPQVAKGAAQMKPRRRRIFEGECIREPDSDPGPGSGPGPGSVSVGVTFFGAKASYTFSSHRSRVNRSHNPHLESTVSRQPLRPPALCTCTHYSIYHKPRAIRGASAAAGSGTVPTVFAQASAGSSGGAGGKRRACTLPRGPVGGGPQHK